MRKAQPPQKQILLDLINRKTPNNYKTIEEVEEDGIGASLVDGGCCDQFYAWIRAWRKKDDYVEP